MRGAMAPLRSTRETFVTRPARTVRRAPPASRRCFLGRSAALCAPWLAWPARTRAASYPATVAALKAARDNETSVYYHYAEFGRQARREGYAGIAYLFTAVAASEMVHATNFARLLARLDADVPPAARPDVAPGTTRENLLKGARGEVHSVDHFYPKLLAEITPEGFGDAITAVRWAWESEQQHRDKMQQILRWSPIFFDKVARTIDEKTGRYYVCQLCGATTNAIPPGKCGVCKQPSTQVRLIEPPTA
jgi:rubrerythrin